MRILSSTFCGFLFVIGAFAVFAAIVWLYSGFKLGFSLGIHYDARAIVGTFPFISRSIAASDFYGWVFLAVSAIIEALMIHRGQMQVRHYRIV